MKTGCAGPPRRGACTSTASAPHSLGTRPEAARSAGPSCYFPPRGAEASSPSDPRHSSACLTAEGKKDHTHTHTHTHHAQTSGRNTRTEGSVKSRLAHTHTVRRHPGETRGRRGALKAAWLPSGALWAQRARTVWTLPRTFLGLGGRPPFRCRATQATRNPAP